MNISELIDAGIKAYTTCTKSSSMGIYIQGQEYENWLSLATRFLEQNFPGDPDTIRFREIAQNANGYGRECVEALMGILTAFNQFPPIPQKIDSMQILHDIFMNFNKFDINIKRRYGDRETIKINDEHDLQDALHSILRLFFSDIRPEDFVPSYAGGNSRVDFLLPEQKLMIETKMTNHALRDKQVGEQLIIDIERYKQNQAVSHLICFVYDKESYIGNPTGLITDLEGLSDERMRITVFISPQ